MLPSFHVEIAGAEAKKHPLLFDVPRWINSQYVTRENISLPPVPSLKSTFRVLKFPHPRFRLILLFRGDHPPPKLKDNPVHHVNPV